MATPEVDENLLERLDHSSIYKPNDKPLSIGSGQLENRNIFNKIVALPLIHNAWASLEILNLSKKSHLLSSTQQGGSMPNTSSSVPFLLSSSMQSIRSRRPSTVLSTGPLGSGTGLWQQLGSGMLPHHRCWV
uniref:Uncharacterized protein n=1 Tax=Glossina austeni TaxID=7395 RepID=A0A1A9URR8_GLOAU